MNGIAALLIGIASAALAGYAAFNGSAILAGAAAVNGTIWVYRTAWGRGGKTGFLAVHTALSALISLTGGFLVPAVSLSAGLYGWDMAAASSSLVGYGRREKRRLTARYAASSFILAGSGVSIGCLGIALRPRLSFPLALGLSVGGLFLAAVVFRLLQREAGG